ncbi:YraN family protein [Flavihumibacter fluvii]|uniref:YraN family protein n=1 Tax=Flavihumibacter fluvii TaxID=2838157 RepID=UPI001BDE6DA5|nr:YraN family protein [Flavihumibacter fluvii]ULQ53126.1 YraN family protein [Flavihumibacter fluvii]
MSTHLAIGRYGEEIAAKWLLENGFTILFNNWRHGRKEIDLIASKKGTLHIIEVKTRRGNNFGPPEYQVNHRKLKYLQDAASAFLEENPQWRKIQFDIISVVLEPNKLLIDYFEDIS